MNKNEQKATESWAVHFLYDSPLLDRFFLLSRLVLGPDWANINNRGNTHYTAYKNTQENTLNRK